MRRVDWTGYARSVLRIVAGFTFAMHGVQKLFGMFGGMGGSTPHMGSLLWVAGVLETFGGGLLLLGLLTRPVAFLLCGEMAVAYFRQHFPHGFWPIQNGGEPAVLYCFIFGYLAIAGGGPLSLDRAIRRK
jgi:putative oxidoreductase